jgi:hypothetical protein
MNPEVLKNIGSQIETENQKEKEEMLLEKIEQISLIYANKKFKEMKKDLKDYEFSQAIKDFTPTESTILEPVFNLEGFDFSEHKKRIELFFIHFYNEVNSIYADGFDLDKITDFVNSEKNRIKEYLEVENLKEAKSDKKENNTKVLNFNKVINIEMDFENKYKDLKKFGFSQLDHFVEIHVEDFYNTGEKNLGPELIKNDLAVVAEYIVDKEPDTAAVIGRSWLLDTPLAERLGFQKIGEGLTKQNDFSTWRQFIDKNGQINQKRFNEFLKTGKLPFKSTRAYMPVEEFLQRYLPENRRGKIMLKKVNKDREWFWLEIQTVAQLIKTSWGDLIENNGDFDSLIKNNKILNELLDFISPNDKQEYLDFFQAMYDKKVPWNDFSKYKSESIKKFDEEINKRMDEDLHQNREVNIE